MKALIQDNRIVQVQETTFPVAPELTWHDVPEDCTTEWTWDGTQAVAPPPPPPYIPPLDALSTDTWTIPADATTPATVTYTSEDTVYFSVNEISHAVEPVEYVTTLEITADAPGPIRVEVKDKQLIITALEVTP